MFNKLNNKKAQIATIDAIFASTIFIILIIIAFYNWNSYSLRNYESSTFNELELLTIQLADLMIKTPGSPNNWETNLSRSPSIIGLAEFDRVLSKNKLTSFQNMSYNSTKTIMNIDRYEYYLLIKQENSSILELGSIPTKKSARIKRSVMYENKPATFEFAVW